MTNFTFISQSELNKLRRAVYDAKQDTPQDRKDAQDVIEQLQQSINDDNAEARKRSGRDYDEDLDVGASIKLGELKEVLRYIEGTHGRCSRSHSIIDRLLQEARKEANRRRPIRSLPEHRGADGLADDERE